MPTIHILNIYVVVLCYIFFRIAKHFCLNLYFPSFINRHFCIQFETKHCIVHIKKYIYLHFSVNYRNKLIFLYTLLPFIKMGPITLDKNSINTHGNKYTKF